MNVDSLSKPRHCRVAVLKRVKSYADANHQRLADQDRLLSQYKSGILHSVFSVDCPLDFVNPILFAVFSCKNKRGVYSAFSIPGQNCIYFEANKASSVKELLYQICFSHLCGEPVILSSDDYLSRVVFPQRMIHLKPGRICRLVSSQVAPQLCQIVDSDTKTCELLVKRLPIIDYRGMEKHKVLYQSMIPRKDLNNHLSPCAFNSSILAGVPSRITVSWASNPVESIKWDGMEFVGIFQYVKVPLSSLECCITVSEKDRIYFLENMAPFESKSHSFCEQFFPASRITWPRKTACDMASFSVPLECDPERIYLEEPKKCVQWISFTDTCRSKLPNTDCDTGSCSSESDALSELEEVDMDSEKSLGMVKVGDSVRIPYEVMESACGVVKDFKDDDIIVEVNVHAGELTAPAPIPKFFTDVVEEEKLESRSVQVTGLINPLSSSCYIFDQIREGDMFTYKSYQGCVVLSKKFPALACITPSNDNINIDARVIEDGVNFMLLKDSNECVDVNGSRVFAGDRVTLDGVSAEVLHTLDKRVLLFANGKHLWVPCNTITMIPCRQ